jgi:type II secretory pathway component PulF
MDAAMADLRNRGLEIQNIGVATSIADPLAPQVRPQATTAFETPTEIPSSDDVIEGRYAKTSMESDASKSVAQGVESYEGHSGRVEGPPTEQRSYVATSVIGPLVGKINLATLGFFFNQLGTMQKAGVPMVQSLDTLAKQSNDFRFRNVVEEMKGHVEAGRPMSAGMQRYPEVLTPVMLSIIRTGEEGGFLDEAMFTVAKYIEDEIELRNLYRRVTIYPKILVVVSILIILGANFVIGAVNAKATKLSSPLTTASTWFWLTPLLIGLFLFFRVGLANFRIKYLWDAFVSHIPFVGKTVRMMSMAKFGRAFGAMYHAGVPLPKVIQLSADSCGNEYMRARLYPAGQRLEGGAGVTETLQATNALSPIVINMLSTGERTGNLDQMLGKMADYYHDEAKTRSVQLGHIVGVVVFLCVAIYIGYIIIQFYMGYGSQVMDFAK